MCSGADFHTFAFFGGHFQGKVKKKVLFLKWCNMWERNQRFVAQHHIGAAAALPHTVLIQFWNICWECLIHMALWTHQVDKVHVCSPLTSLFCLTYIFPSRFPTTLALFFTARPYPFGLLVPSFWAWHQVFFRSLSLLLFFKIGSFKCLPWL